MRKLIMSTIMLAVLVLSSCSSTQSLQEYYVDNKENPNFISLDVPASILNLSETDLNNAQKEAISSLKKLNILAFKKSDENTAEFKLEQTKVKNILKDETYVELMKLNSSFGKGVIKYLGDEDAIDEVIIYGSSTEKGFMVVRVLGENMNPAHLIQFINALEKSEYKGEGLGELGELLKG